MRIPRTPGRADGGAGLTQPEAGGCPVGDGDRAIGADLPSHAAKVAAESGLPDLFGALQQQLGLKLESHKESVEVLVIDHAGKPAEN